MAAWIWIRLAHDPSLHAHHPSVAETEELDWVIATVSESDDFTETSVKTKNSKNEQKFGIMKEK